MAVKARLWAFLLYPESMPGNWKDILAGAHIPVLVSPLHDSDVDDNGEIKKPHYHVLTIFDGPIPEMQLLDVLGDLNVKHVEKVISRMSYERYLCHLDNPEKYQYPIAEIQCFGGAVPKFCIDADFRDGFIAVTRIIEQQGFTVYADLSRYIAFECPEFIHVLDRYSSHFNNVCRSRFDCLHYNGFKTDNLSYVKYRAVFSDWSS